MNLFINFNSQKTARIRIILKSGKNLVGKIMKPEACRNLFGILTKTRKSGQDICLQLEGGRVVSQSYDTIDRIEFQPMGNWEIPE